MPVPRLDPDRTALLVIDLQKKLLPAIDQAPALLRRAGRLIDGFRAMRLPVLLTEQYPKGLGPTASPILKHVGAPAVHVEKLRFSACVDAVMNGLAERGVRSVVVCGVEAHVCVQQTVLDLIDAGYVTAVALDAVGSRRASDRDAAVLRMTGAGALPATVESVLFELTRDAGSDRFKLIRPIIT